MNQKYDATMTSWKILVVDDERDVLTTTVHTLMDLEVLGQSLDLLTANTAAEALQVLEKHPDVAVILLDVVMEKMQSGLTLVTQIRQSMGNQAVRIILRTGNPGEAPEQEVVLNYGIDDYIHKGSVTRNRIITSVVTAIKAFDQLKRVERLGAAIKALFDLSTAMTYSYSIQELASLLADRLHRVLPNLVNGAVAYAGRETLSNRHLLTFLPATRDQNGLPTTPQAANIPETTMLGAYVAKASAIEGNETFLYKASGKIGCLVWARKNTPIDAIDTGILQNLAGLIGVNLDRLKNVKYRQEDSVNALETFFKEFDSPLDQLKNTQTAIFQLVASLAAKDERLTSLLSANQAIVARMAATLKKKRANVRRLNETESDVRLEVEDVGELVKGEIERLRERWMATGPLEVRVQPDCLANVNRELVRGIFEGLLDNAVEAVKAAKDSRARTQYVTGQPIRITVEHVGDRVVLAIADPGVGIAQDHLPYVFMPYFSGDERVHGVGLSLVKSSVERLGGTIGVVSKIGEGAKFEVALAAISI